MRSLKLLCLIVCIFLIISACGSGHNNSGDNDEHLLDQTEASAIIGPSGGTVEVTDAASKLYGVEVEIPADAIEEDTDITISQSEDDLTIPASVLLVGEIVDFGPDGLEFDEPVHITLSYSDDDVEIEDTLHVYVYDGNSWKGLEFVSRDTDANTVTALTSHFSNFAIFNAIAAQSSSFSPSVHGFEIRNFNDSCSQMVGYAKWLFNEQCNFNDYSKNMETIIVNELKSSIPDYYGFPASPYPNIHDVNIASQLMSNLRVGPQILIVDGYTINSSIEDYSFSFSHAILVYKYSSTPTGATFYYYDPNHPKQVNTLAYTNGVFDESFSGSGLAAYRFSREGASSSYARVFYKYPCDDIDGDTYINDKYNGDDCDDTDASINPGASEIADDGIDQDCNGKDTITCIIDNDQDGHGTNSGTTTLASDGLCDTPQSESKTSDDCDDTDSSVNPSATEIPDNGIDDDCNPATSDCQNGSICNGEPTFIQLSEKRKTQNKKENINSNSGSLIAKISVPYDNALVRADIPIFGLAYGTQFEKYRVEVGEGINPLEWTLIESSSMPETEDVTLMDIDDSSDLTIHGNLATWDTGLKNYVYLPSHPKDHPINLKGTYTVRLVVTGKDGSTVEDRVTVDVANVIPNAWGGIAKSKDEKVVLAVPEQAIMDSFRLISIKDMADAPAVLSVDRHIVGSVYEVSEPGERFTKEALLQINFTNQEIHDKDHNQLGIYGYNTNKKEWEYLSSMRTGTGNSVVAGIRKLHSHYALMASGIQSEGSTIDLADHSDPKIQKVSTQSSNSHYQTRDTFEDGLGEWSNRDGDVGAEVSLDNTTTFDGTNALKITNTNAGGNFAVNVKATPFNAKAYPLIQFDYRIPYDIKTNLLVKVSGKWYEIGFTDDYNELRDKRVNIARIGKIDGVIADDKWHTLKFNLYKMLKTKTGNTIVDQLIMADWDVIGYMKLIFGHNQKGATYYIDNFTISREVYAGLNIDSDNVLIDNFNQKNKTNALGGETLSFISSKGAILLNDFTEDAYDQGNALKLSYDMSSSDSYAGYITSLRNLDLEEFQVLSFLIKTKNTSNNFFIGLKDQSGHEHKVSARRYLIGEAGAWQQVIIPLVAFANINDWGRMDNLSLTFTEKLHNKGEVHIDNIEFHKEIKSVTVDDFENINAENFLSRGQKTFISGVATINGKYTRGSPNGIYRISYGGNIGEIKAYASDLFSYAGWTTNLGGIDCSQCKTLSFKVRGNEGGERPNIYLDDGNFRWSVDIEKYASITKDWKTVTIPLKDFAEYGVDLTHLAELQMVFEWDKMSGTIYIDDIMFGSQVNIQ